MPEGEVAAELQIPEEVSALRQPIPPDVLKQLEEVKKQVNAEAHQSLPDNLIDQLKQRRLSDDLINKLQQKPLPDDLDSILAGLQKIPDDSGIDELKKLLRQIEASRLIDGVAKAPDHLREVALLVFEMKIQNKNDAMLRETRDQLADRMAKETDPDKRELYKKMLDAVNAELDRRRDLHDLQDKLRPHRPSAEELRKLKEPALDESTIKKIGEKSKQAMEAVMRQQEAGRLIDWVADAPGDLQKEALSGFKKEIGKKDDATLKEIRKQLAERMAKEPDPEKRALYKKMLDAVNAEFDRRLLDMLRSHRPPAEDLRKLAEEARKLELRVTDIKLGTTVMEITASNGSNYRLDGNKLTIRAADGRLYQVQLPARDAAPEVKKQIQALREELARLSNDNSAPEYMRKRAREALERLDKAQRP